MRRATCVSSGSTTRIKELTNGVGADSVLECVGTQESMMQAVRSTRSGGSIGYVGVPHGVQLDRLGTIDSGVDVLRKPGALRATIARASEGR
jgi:threonine dehydrogenase-like Zn-dependent dehydrogenase